MARPLPMFPLGTVLFPYAELPLHVFEPRYRVMVHDLLEGDREFGVVLIERGHEVGGGDTRFRVGTLATVVRAAPYPDGRFALLAVGVQRLRVVEWLPDDPYPRALVEELAEEEPGPGALEARDRVAGELVALVEAVRAVEPDALVPAPDLSDDPVRASFEAAAIAPLGPLDAQRLLSTDDVTERLSVLAGLLRDEIEVMTRLRRPPPA